MSRWRSLLSSLGTRFLGADTLRRAHLRNEEKLRVSEERFRLLVENAADDFFLHDDKGRFLDVNERACRSTGYTREELLGLRVADISLDYSQEEKEDMWRHMEPGTAFTVNSHHRRKDGSVFPVEVRISCHLIGEQKLFLGMVRDNSERLGADRAIQRLNAELEQRVVERTKQLHETSEILRLQSERLALAATAARTGLWDYNIDTDSLHCDAHWYELIGRDPGNPVRCIADWKPHIHPDDAARVTEVAMPSLVDLVAQKQDYSIVFRIVGPAGEIRWLKSTACLVEGEPGRPNRAVGVVMDITESHLAEENLQRSYASLRRAESLARIGSWTFDVASGQFSCSDMLYEMTGLDPAGPPLTLADLRTIYSPADYQTANQAILQCIGQGVPYGIDLQFLQPNGQSFACHIRGQAIWDALGRIIGVTGTVQDIAEREKIRQRLESQSEALEQAAAALAKTRDAALDASHAKSAFLANMSHELRTPLNAIIGFSEIMKDGLMGPISERYRDYAGDIYGSGAHLLELINQILDLSKIEAGRMELHESAFAPRDILDDCARLLQERAQKAGVRLVVAVPSAPTSLLADELKFKQIVLNLVSNAIKFTPAEGEVHISATVSQDGFSMQVRDTGMGMKAEDIPMALEPFRQVGDDTGHKQQGTGLGLPLAKAFVELHGGTFTLASELHRGTIVTITLPSVRLLSPIPARAAQRGAA